MKKLLFVAIILLGLGGLTSSFTNPSENQELNSNPRLKSPQTLSADPKFISAVKSHMVRTFSMLKVLKQKSVKPADIKEQIGRLQAQNLSDSEQLEALDKIFKQSMAVFFEEQTNFQASLVSLEKEYEPISDQILKDEYKEVGMKLFVDEPFPELVKYGTCSNDNAFMSCVLDATYQMIACYKACRAQGQMPRICLIVCSFEDNAVNVVSCFFEHCI